MESKMLTNKYEVEQFLQEQKIAYKQYKHKPALSIEDLLNDPGNLEHSKFIKNLVYIDKKKQKYYFILANENTKISKYFWKEIGTNNNNIRFANEEQISQLLITKTGAVNIFALANDKENKFNQVIIDSKLEREEYLSFHPQDNSFTFELKAIDILNILQKKFNKQIIYKNLEIEEQQINKQQQEQQQQEQQLNVQLQYQKEENNETKLKIEYKKQEDFSNWYSQVIIKGELLDYYDISGCYIIRPTGYFIWEQIQQYLNIKFKEHGIKNCYFPLFVSKKNLTSEEEHIKGFQAEVAWVTHSGQTQLQEPIAIRPTSETIMYPAYARWIQSHRDLPLLLNQWTNIVRWEFKHPTPFIRAREFLWQEGHTAHSSKEEAEKLVYDILGDYEDTYKNLLAIPVIKGIKSENEKFAGADYTTSCETFIPENGRAIQACTSHLLGQNFAKIFNITFLDQQMKSSYCWQTSWGFTTRSIGILVMIHSDDQGLILPPKVAPIQVIIVPILFKESNREQIIENCKQIMKKIKSREIRVHLDTRDTQSTGFKFNDWELKGVPIRLEVGPKDLQNNEVKLVRRVDGQKTQVKQNQLGDVLEKELQNIHNLMYEKAQQKINQSISEVINWEQFMIELNKQKVVMTPWCLENECEDKVKQQSVIESKQMKNEENVQLSGSAKTLCIPLQQKELQKELVCFNCGKKAKKWVLWGRSY